MLNYTFNAMSNDTTNQNTLKKIAVNCKNWVPVLDNLDCLLLQTQLHFGWMLHFHSVHVSASGNVFVVEHRMYL